MERVTSGRVEGEEGRTLVLGTGDEVNKAQNLKGQWGVLCKVGEEELLSELAGDPCAAPSLPHSTS